MDAVAAINPSIEKIGREFGRTIQVQGGKPLLLDGTAHVYLVTSGQVELFSVYHQSGQVTDKRTYLFSMQAGELIFGVPQEKQAGASVKNELGMLAAGKSGGELIAVDQQQLIHELRKTESLQALEAALQQWIRHWQQALPLQQEIEIASSFMEQPQPQLEQVLVQLQDEWKASLAEAAKKEQERLQKKQENDRMFMSRAVEQLSSVTEVATVPVKPGLMTNDSLNMACAAVGAAMGMTIRPLPDQQGHRSREPIYDIAKASHVRVRQVVLKDEWWKHDNGPMVAFLQEENRAVALLQETPGHYQIHDPTAQTTVPVTAEEAESLKPFAYTFYRTLPAHALTVKDILKFGAQRSLKRDFIMVLVMGLAGGLLGMIMPIATGILFDQIIPEAERAQVLQMAAILFVVAISILLFQVTRSLALLRIEGRMDSSIQAAVWDRLLSLPVPFFRDYSAGDLAMRANSINTIRREISGVAMTTIFSGIFSSFNFFLLFYYDFRLALAALVLVVVSVLVTATLSLLQIRYQRKLVQLEGKISGQVLQVLQGIAKFRVTGAESRAFYLWAQLFSAQKKTAYSARMLANWLAVFNTVFPVVASMVLFYAVLNVGQGGSGGGSGLSPGQFIAFFAAFTVFLGAMVSMSNALISMINIVPLYERAKPILQTTPEVAEAMANPGRLSGHIEISRLSFKYKEGQPLIVEDLSLQIKPGEFVAIIGPSGSGKSTLFRLLLGFEKPNSGSVYYDGQDLKQLDVRAVRSQLGVVLQNGKVMSGDIFTNIVGSSNLTIDDAWEAARQAGFDEDIRQMPMGMHTVVSEGGGTLSGGQRQRMLIARAIVKRPRIILFDEATSALDNRTQAIVSESLEKLEATRVVIAHRLSTIMNADRIVVLEQGRIVESGTYHDLLQQDGLFAELAKRQLA